MSKWQPIETAPKDGTQILVCRAGDEIGANAKVEITEWYTVERWRFEERSDGAFNRVRDAPIEGWNGNGHRATHWMPLPEPPVTAD